MINLIETGQIKEWLQQNPQKADEIISRTQIGICITNRYGNYVAVNDAYCRIYGYSANELLGKHFTLVVPAEFHEKMQLLHDKFLRDKVEISREWKVLTKSGKEISISVDTAYSEAIFDQTPHKITFVQQED